ncbi:hypothetical protein DFH06DRAFT_365453 [Mycena polygramma]|nr:hypothetical protein DFH06DRAFT_365453 [Mycena polygramma]
MSRMRSKTETLPVTTNRTMVSLASIAIVLWCGGLGVASLILSSILALVFGIVGAAAEDEGLCAVAFLCFGLSIHALVPGFIPLVAFGSFYMYMVTGGDNTGGGITLSNVAPREFADIIDHGRKLSRECGDVCSSLYIDARRFGRKSVKLCRIGREFMEVARDFLIALAREILAVGGAIELIRKTIPFPAWFIEAMTVIGQAARAVGDAIKLAAQEAEEAALHASSNDTPCPPYRSTSPSSSTPSPSAMHPTLRRRPQTQQQ